MVTTRVHSRSLAPPPAPIQHHRFLPRCCFPSSCCFGKYGPADGARSLCFVDFFSDISFIFFFLFLRQNINSQSRASPSWQVSLSWSVAFLFIDWVLLFAIGQKKVRMISVFQLLIVARVVCCVAVVLALSVFALPDLESFVSRWRNEDSPREGVLACVFGLFAYSAWFAALHVYLIMLLNGTKSAAEAAAQSDDDKTVSTLQAGSHARIVQVMRHSLARRLNRLNGRRSGSVDGGGALGSSLATTSSSLASSIRDCARRNSHSPLNQ